MLITVWPSMKACLYWTAPQVYMQEELYMQEMACLQRVCLTDSSECSRQETSSSSTCWTLAQQYPLAAVCTGCSRLP